MKNEKQESQETPLTRGEFEDILTMAAQPRGLSRKPDSKDSGKSVDHPSGDCSDNHIHPDNEQGI